MCVVLLLIGVLVVSCSQTIDPLTEISEIKVVLDRYYIAQQKEDMTALAALFAQDDDLVVFGFRQEERQVGWEAVKAMYQKQMDSIEGLQTTPKSQVIDVSRDGQAAWASSLNHASGKIGAQPVEMDYRTTVVLEKRGGKWLIVHLHNSLLIGQESPGS
jgi:uncharacterized protein (TIGR02246 family)